MTPIKVLICDDHQMVRQGLRSFLELHDELEIVGESTNGVEALADIDALTPDVVLLDLQMPQKDGIEVLKELQSHPAPPKVIVLSSFLDDESVFSAIEVGADGYQLKDITPQELLQAIQAAYQGQSPLHPTISQKLMKRIAKPTRPQRVDDLTERELEVLRLVAKGLKNREIGDALHISPKTAKTHVSNILYKLGISDRIQLAVWAHKHDLA